MNIFPITVESDWSERFQVDRSDLHREYPNAPGYYEGLRLMSEGARDLENTALELIIAELKEFPELYDGGADFTLAADPYTVLDPFAIPPDPCRVEHPSVPDYEAAAAAYEVLTAPFGPGADSLETFRDDFLTPEDGPFTFLGTWYEEGAGHAAFGYCPRSANPKLIVLFC